MDLIAKLLKVRYANQSGIIYTTTVKDTEVIRDELKKRGWLLKQILCSIF